MDGWDTFDVLVLLCLGVAVGLLIAVMSRPEPSTQEQPVPEE